MMELGAFADPADAEVRLCTITEVRKESDGHTIKADDGWSFFAPTGPIVPEVGMQARFYGRGIGHTVRGLVIAGQTFFYGTKEQEEERHRQWVVDLKRERAEEYERTKDEMAARLATYPDVFRRRIERFLANSPTAWEHQGYEMAVCDAALLIIEKYPDEASHRGWVENEYKPDIPESFELGLSGNQWDMARRLAGWWHIDRDNVRRDHAAISIIVGCEEAGCPPSPRADLSKTAWWEVLCVERREPLEKVESVYRQLLREYHPDRGGAEDAMAKINAAVESARREKQAESYFEVDGLRDRRRT